MPGPGILFINGRVTADGEADLRQPYYAGRISQSTNTSCRKLHEKRNFVDEIGMREICMQVSTASAA